MLRLHGINDHHAHDRELAVCADHREHWCDEWCWTFDPREADPVLPFDLFPRQRDFLRWLADREAAREGGLVEKSRDMGITWLCCVYAVHGWLFRDGFSVGFGSLKREEVDELGNMDTILEKCRFLLRNLPAWMLPAGYRERDHANFCRIVNPANGSSITGEGGDEIGRGGRKAVFFLDEAARVARPDKVDAALSQTTNCRIDVSTPNGPGNSFYRRRFSGAVPVFTFHWKDDPRKGPEWYEAEKRRLANPVIVAQELDIDYTASVEGICIPAAWVRAATGLGLPPGNRTVAGLDIADEGGDRTALVARRGPAVLPPVVWGQSNTTATAWRARDEAAALGAAAVAYDVVGVGVGVKGTWNTAETPLPFVAHAVNGGESPTDARWPDGRTSKELFLNLRAELWWRLRARFEKAYEFREQGVRHPPDEMISLPDDPRFAELSLPLVERTETGKIKIESKRHLRGRGVKSPDVADALALSMADMPEPATVGGYVGKRRADRTWAGGRG